MSSREDMFDHFSRVASHYASVRTTDEAPVRFIREALAGRAEIRAADVGCGDGRYDLLLFEFLPNLHLSCVDINPDMLAKLSERLGKARIRRFETRVCGAADLDLGERRLDAVFTFNAVHHFDFPVFIAAAGRALREDGRIFIYTRTPEQNARSIWGRFFPGFCERETRLFALADMEAWVAQAAGLSLAATKTFRFERCASLERLVDQARGRHYSTFSLYDEAEFERACAAFEADLRRHVDDCSRIVWHDENVMLVIGRSA